MQWRIGRKSERVIGCPRKSVLIRNFRWSVSGDFTQDESRKKEENRKHPVRVSDLGNKNDESGNVTQDGGPEPHHWNDNYCEGYYFQGPQQVYSIIEEQDNYEAGPENDGNGMYVNGMWMPMSDLDQYVTSVEGGGDFLEPVVYSQIPVLFHPLPSVSHTMYPRFRTMHAPDVPLYPNYFIPTNPHYFYYLTRPCPQSEDDGVNSTQEPFWNVQPETPPTDQPEACDQQQIIGEEPNQYTGEDPQAQVAEGDKEEPVLAYPYPGYGFGEPVYSVPVLPLLTPPARQHPRTPWSVSQAQKRRRRKRKEDYADYAYIPPRKANQSNLKEGNSVDSPTAVASNANSSENLLTQKEHDNAQITSPPINLSASSTIKAPGGLSLSQRIQEPNIDKAVENDEHSTTLQYITGIVDEIILLAQIEASKKSRSLNIKAPANSVKYENNASSSLIEGIYFQLVREVTVEVATETVKASQLLSDSNISALLTAKEDSTQAKMEICSNDPMPCHKGDSVNHAKESQDTIKMSKVSNGSEFIENGNDSSNPRPVVSSKDSFTKMEHYLIDKSLFDIPDVHRKPMQNKTEDNCIEDANVDNLTENRAEKNSQNMQNNLTAALCSDKSSEEKHGFTAENISNEIRGQNHCEPEVSYSSSQSKCLNVPKNTPVENNSKPNNPKSFNTLHSLHNEKHTRSEHLQSNEKDIKFSNTIHCKNQEQRESSTKEVNDEKESSLSDAHHASPYSYLSYIVNSEALIRETELELSKLQQLTARSPMHAGQSIYTLAYDSNVTDQSETDEPQTPIPSPVPKRVNNFDDSELSSDEMQQDIPRAEIIVHEADSASDAGSEDVELIPHRYESRNGDLKDKHVYVNKLSLAMELLKTHENLPYDDEFKRVVTEENEENQNGKATIVCSQGDTTKKTKVLVGKINLGFIADSNAFKEMPPVHAVDVGCERNITGSSSSHPTAVNTDDVERSHRNSRVSTADSGVQSEDSGDEIGEEAKEVYGSLGFTEFEDNELWNPVDNTAAGYRRFGAQARQRMNIFTPRAGIVNPCFCCIIM